MYKFKASQFYKVSKDGVEIRFDYFGEYHTNKLDEVEVLKSLVPTYIELVEEPKVKPAKVEPKEPKVEVKVEAEVEVKLCSAETKAGKPCKNEAVENSEFCKFHQK